MKIDRNYGFLAPIALLVCLGCDLQDKGMGTERTIVDTGADESPNFGGPEPGCASTRFEGAVSAYTVADPNNAGMTQVIITDADSECRSIVIREDHWFDPPDQCSWGVIGSVPSLEPGRYQFHHAWDSSDGSDGFDPCSAGSVGQNSSGSFEILSTSDTAVEVQICDLVLSFAPFVEREGTVSVSRCDG